MASPDPVKGRSLPDHSASADPMTTATAEMFLRQRDAATEAWKARGRELNELYDTLTAIVEEPAPGMDPVADLKALGAQRDRLRAALVEIQKIAAREWAADETNYEWYGDIAGIAEETLGLEVGHSAAASDDKQPADDGSCADCTAKSSGEHTPCTYCGAECGHGYCKPCPALASRETEAPQ